MEFEQKLLCYLLTEGQYNNSNLRPRDIQLITARSSFKSVTVKINCSEIENFEVSKLYEETLVTTKQEQYRFICLLSEINDEQACRLSISPSQITKLRSLSYKDIARLSNDLKIDIVNVKINHNLLDLAIHKRKHLNKEQETIENLIKAGASKRFMTEIFQVHPKKFKFLRQAFKMEKAIGRPRRLTEVESHAVYASWERHNVKPKGEAYLEIYRDLCKTPTFLG